MGTRYFVGVDLHKAVVQVCVLDEKGQIVEERRFRYSSLEGGLKVVEYLRQWWGLIAGVPPGSIPEVR